MVVKLRNYINLSIEFPWPFFVSIFFFDVYCDMECDSLMMSGWGPKIANAVRKTVLVGAGGYSGILMNKYGTKPQDIIYGNVVYTPSNYNEHSIFLLKRLAAALSEKDQKMVYKCWSSVLNNPDGVYTKSYAKLNNTINSMTREYNQEVPEQLKVTEVGFFEFMSLDVSEKSLGIVESEHYNNVVETLTMEIANRKSQYLLEHRRSTDSTMQIANLGNQPDNDCVFIHLNKQRGGIDMCYVDCKKTDDMSLSLKFQELLKNSHNIKGSKAIFGCNLYVVASDKSDIILTQQEIKLVLEFIEKVAQENPGFFEDYQESKEFQDFKATGNFAALSSSVYPFPKAITSKDFQKHLRFSHKDQREFLDQLKKYNESCNDRPWISIIDQDDN